MPAPAAVPAAAPVVAAAEGDFGDFGDFESVRGPAAANIPATAAPVVPAVPAVSPSVVAGGMPSALPTTAMGAPAASSGQWELAFRQLQAEKEALSTRLQGLGAREQQLMQELARSQAKTEQLTQELSALQGSFQSELGQASSASAQVR